MRMPRLFRYPDGAPWLASLLLLALASNAMHAQTTVSDDMAGDPPDRVARLSYLAGDLGFLPDGAAAWSDASVNRPLTRGDRLASDADGRAELEFDGASLRVAGDTDIGVVQLDNQLAQIEMTRGTLNLSVRTLGQGESYEIDTPAIALVADQPGVYRVDVDDNDGSTRVTALEGQATAYGENQASRLLVGGHSYLFSDSALNMVVEQYSGTRDAFDQWCSERDLRYAQSPGRRYVSGDMIGYEDLDAYGRWEDDAGYGQVWYPSGVGTDWAPYSTGHWAYVAPWGWTWIDNAAWGFAPYHYGRWVSMRGRWGWIPGPRALRPVYAPALVAFVGGPGWRVPVGAGAPIGWFPLGPGEVYNPWYHASHDYYRRVNEHNLHGTRRQGDRNHDVARIEAHYHHYRDGQPMPGQDYVNRHAPHGITAVPGDAFAHGRRVQAERIDAVHAWRTAPVIARGDNLPQTRPGAGDATRVRRAPAGHFDRTVVARHLPPDRGHGGMHVDSRAGNVHLLDGGDRHRPGMQDHAPAAPAGMPPRIAASAPFDGGTRRIRSRADQATLPDVPRIVRAGAGPTMTRHPAYRPPSQSPRPTTLPAPPRITPAPGDAGHSWQGRPAREETRVVHAPSRGFNADEAARRFRRTTAPHTAPAVKPSAPATRPAFQPTHPMATPHPQPVPGQRNLPLQQAPHRELPRQTAHGEPQRRIGKPPPERDGKPHGRHH